MRLLKDYIKTYLGPENSHALLITSQTHQLP